jgi:hypothetical protein
MMELLTGEPPYKGSSAKEIRESHKIPIDIP